MEGTCNLQCWCHVPTRGRSKPPCYLCVLQECCLSCRSDSFPSTLPSAPPLPLEMLHQDPAPSYQESVNTASDEGCPGGGGGPYEWRTIVAAHASVNSFLPNTQEEEEEEEDPMPNTESDVHLQYTEGAVGGLVDEAGPDAPSDHCDIVPSGNHEAVEDRLSDLEFRDIPETIVRRFPSRLRTNGSRDMSPDEGSQTKESKMNGSCNNVSQQSTLDLSELIKNIVLGADDNTHQESITNRVNFPSRWGSQDLACHRGASWLHGVDHRFEGSRQSRNRTNRMGSRLLSASDEMVDVRPRSNEYISSVIMERNYKRINKINRRESSSEAARRYLQNVQNQARRSSWHSNTRGVPVPRDTVGELPGQTDQAPTLMESETCDR